MDTLGWLTIAAAALVGLAAGRYVAVVVAWVPAEPASPVSDTRRRRLPPARCPHGVAALLAADLLPGAGRPRLRGRCPECAARLGAGSVAAELLTAAVLAVLAAGFGPSPVLPAFCYFGVLAVALALIDARTQRLPDFLTLPSYPIAAALLAAAAPATPGGVRSILDALTGMAVAWLLFLAQALIYPAGIGWGDVKLSGVVGLYLGWLGLGAVAAGLFLGYLLAAIVGVTLLIAGRASRTSRLAFGPFLLTGALAVIVASSFGVPFLMSLSRL
jgi:leader peptidase (prepilin peptidase)/N-methyltransferase